MSDETREHIERLAKMFGSRFILAAHQRTAESGFISGAMEYAGRFVFESIPDAMPGSNCTADNHEHDCCCAAYTQGFDDATKHQHPISYAQGERAGPEKAIEECIQVLRIHSEYFEYDRDQQGLMKELEKLKL